MYKEIDTKQMLSDAKFYEGYSRYIDELNRYETWDESVERVMNMHRDFYKDKMTEELSNMIDYAEKAYKEKRVLGAQRALQFGGEQLLKHHARLYNCSSSYVDREEVFGEIFYFLLAGAGCGLSIQKRHVNRLSKIVSRVKQSKVYIIEDSIEGWASSIDVLLSSFFENGGKYPEYQGRKVYFDFQKIRPKGAKISGGFKAPGPEPLRNTLNKIENMLISIAEQKRQMKPIEIYDIIMHISDSVLAGGVRRSSVLIMFDLDDQEMMKAKTGDWFITNPQRARSNNSVVLKKDLVTFEQFQSIMKDVKEFGEPGFIWVDDEDITYNPCVSGDTLLQVKDYFGKEYDITMKEFVEKFNNSEAMPLVKSYDHKSNKELWCMVSAAAMTRKNTKLIEIQDIFSDKKIKVTYDHKIWTENRGWVEAQDLKNNDKLKIFDYSDEYDTSNIYMVDLEEKEDVYDITVPETSCFYGNGILVHNCVEVGMYPKLELEDGTWVSGWQGCNLTEINGGFINSLDDFKESCKAASILGTLQAGYTHFKFLTDVSKKIFEKESLIGVSITGWMNSPDVLLNTENQKTCADIVKEYNKKVASLIGINPAARTTNVKPAGNSCTTFDTLIKTEKGSMSLKDIFDYCTNNLIDINRDFVGDDTWFQVNKELKVYDENGESKDIIGLYVNGMARIYEIEFEDGSIYKFTDHHKLKTNNGWKFVCDLTEEDEIVSL